MNTALAKTESKDHRLVARMAERYQLEPTKFLATIQKTVFPQRGAEPTLEQTAAFLVVANQYELNPFIKEIYAFPSRSGGIVPIVSVDGWLTLINRQSQLDGIDFEDHLDEHGKLGAVTCKIYRKDRARPTEVTEYMNECKRDTDTWDKWPSRMLRHKALIQCARYAFGFAGIYDPDEAERIAENETQPANVAQIAEKTKEKTEALRARLQTAIPPVIDAEIVSDEPQVVLEFNPLGESAGDYLSAKDAKKIADLCGKLEIDPDETASKLFKMSELKVDDLSKEAAERLIADLKARTEAA